MNELISAFLHHQTCATICCLDEDGNPFCFTCFYAFNGTDGLLYFKSAAASYHTVLLGNNHLVAGTVLPDKLSKLVVKGIQFEGEVLKPDNPLSKQAYGYYHKKHPLALAMQGDIWVIQLNRIKMTDSTKAFAKKTVWRRGEAASIGSLQHN